MSARLIALLMLMACTCAVPAAAQKTDLVTLVNGNVVTCELKTLSKGRLAADTDHMGTVNFEWDKVVSIGSLRTFQIETSSGARYVGTLVVATPGSVAVASAPGEVLLTLMDVVYLAPIGAGFLQRIDGSLNIGASFAEATGVAQMTLTADAIFRRPNFELDGTASTYVTRQRDAEDSVRQTLQAGYSRPFGRSWSFMGRGGLERNPSLGYDLRSSIGGGISRAFIRSNRAGLSVGAGLSTSSEVSVDGEAIQALDVLLGLRQSFYTYDYPKTQLSSSLTAYPSLSQSGRVRLEFEGALKRELIRDFTVGVTAYNSYDNRPPTTVARKNDFTISLSVGWTF